MIDILSLKKREKITCDLNLACQVWINDLFMT